jgi:Tol biopolymer transport system component
MKPRPLLLFLLPLLLAALPLPGADLVSLDAMGTAPGNSGSFAASLSADGRFVAFTSIATNLIPGGTPQFNVFVRNLRTGVTVLASVNDPPYTGIPGDAHLSADGRYVAYERSTCTSVICVDFAIFVRDLQTGTTTLVSVDRNGMPGQAYGPVISADGRHVAFVGVGNNFVPNDTNGANDVFVRDLDAGITRLASINAAGTASGNGASSGPVLSADGRFVAFASDASDLVAGDGNGAADVFWRDLLTGTTRLVSANLAGTGTLGTPSSGDPGISADGSRVSFVSNASDLVATDTNQTFDVFLRDLPDGPTRLISINDTGTDSASGGGGRAFLTPNGRFVAFDSAEGNASVFLRDVDAGVTRLVSADSFGNPATADSELFDSPAGFQVASDDGRFVAFRSDSALAGGVKNVCQYDPCHQGYLRDVQTGATTLLSVTPAGDANGNFGAEAGQVSGDGRVVVFEALSSNLSRQPDANESVDVFSVGAPAPIAIPAVPTLGTAGLALLAMMIAVLGLWSLRR